MRLRPTSISRIFRPLMLAGLVSAGLTTPSAVAQQPATAVSRPYGEIDVDNTVDSLPGFASVMLPGQKGVVVDAVLGADGAVWAIDDRGGLFRVGSAGGVRRYPVLSPLRKPTPTNITATADGRLQVAVNAGGDEGFLVTFTLDGRPLRTRRIPALFDLVRGPGGLPWFASTYSTGTVGFVGGPDEIRSFGLPQQEFSDGNAVAKLALRADGRLAFIAASGGFSSIDRAGRRGTFKQFDSDSASDNLLSMAQTPDGLLVAPGIGNTLVNLTAKGTAETLPIGGPPSTLPDSLSMFPTAVAAGPDGRSYYISNVTEPSSDDIATSSYLGRIDAGGAVTEWRMPKTGTVTKTLFAGLGRRL